MTSRPQHPAPARRRAWPTALATVPFAGTAPPRRVPYAAAPAARGRGTAAAAPSVAPAAPVGKLTPSTPGCTVTPASAPDPETVRATSGPRPARTRCSDNRSRSGATPRRAAGAASAPGPVIVARQGDRVELTLHNGLAEPTSLALPGSGRPPSPRACRRGRDDRRRARRHGALHLHRLPGRHVPLRGGPHRRRRASGGDGPRRRARRPRRRHGLRPRLRRRGGARAQRDRPRPQRAPGDASTCATSTRYRLINGKPFPSSDPVRPTRATRCCCATSTSGSELHPMSPLGAGQTALSHDGHALGLPEPSVVVPVDPGVTVDALVTVPSGPESRSRSSSRRAARQRGPATADPLAVAFGGMLTFLDTNAPPPSSDEVGPVSTASRPRRTRPPARCR